MKPTAILQDLRHQTISFYFKELEELVPANEVLARGLVSDDEHQQLEGELEELGWGGGQ